MFLARSCSVMMKFFLDIIYIVYRNWNYVTQFGTFHLGKPVPRSSIISDIGFIYCKLFKCTGHTQIGEIEKGLLYACLYLPVSKFNHSPISLCIKLSPLEPCALAFFYQQVGYHPKYKTTRCFLIKRTDGTYQDFSYHKCILGALESIAPNKAKIYKDKRLRHGEMWAISQCMSKHD